MIPVKPDFVRHSSFDVIAELTHFSGGSHAGLCVQKQGLMKNVDRRGETVRVGFEPLRLKVELQSCDEAH